MLECSDCLEWYHPICVMVGEKSIKKFVAAASTKKGHKYCCPRCCIYNYGVEYNMFPSLRWRCDLIDKYKLCQIIENELLMNLRVTSKEILAGQRLLKWVNAWQIHCQNYFRSCRQNSFIDFSVVQSFVFLCLSFFIFFVFWNFYFFLIFFFECKI